MKHLRIIVPVLVFLAASPVFVFAIQEIGVDDIQGRLGIRPPPQEAQTVPGLLNVVAGVVRVIYIVFFILAVMIFLFVAFEYLMSQGEPEKIKKAQDWLIYAAVAVVIALIAVGVGVIINRFLISPYAGGSYGGYGYPRVSVPAPGGPPVTASPNPGQHPPIRGEDTQAP